MLQSAQMFKKNIKSFFALKSLPVYIIFIIASFIFFWSSQLFSLIFREDDSLFISEALSAFTGAFFAFLFLRLTSFLEKYYLRQRKHYNALASMEILLDEVVGVIKDDIYLLPDFRRVIMSGNVYASLLQPLPLERQYYDKLHDIELINDLYKLNYDIRRLNDDIENSNIWYLKLRDLYTSHQIIREDYIVNSQIMAERLKVLESALNMLFHDVIKLRAIVTLRLDFDRPLLTRFVHSLIDFQRQDLTEEMIKNKTIEIEKDIEESAINSHPRIQKIREGVSKIQ